MCAKSQRDRVIEHVKDFYGVDPEYLWEKTPNSGIFRNPLNKKWFGIFMDIPKSRLGFEAEEIVYVLNVKCDPVMAGDLQREKGFFPAYHMNKDKWITVILDDTVKDETVFYLIKQSYDLINSKVKINRNGEKSKRKE
ncbi:MAG: MmcQ/YjbR family DNA-binding protein [Firmicutes bacterium]|nr:MmcQ/YjbR family DNA-binding protein [[Eubacterium] siraeum]MCM1488411.1 MmcQ/YjbR family DNA-binding protein [Bacillota bacterium]